MKRSKDLNAPEHWLAWLRVCQGDERCPIQARGHLAMLTGTDVRVLGAIAAVLHAGSYNEPAVLAAVRALLPLMQAKCWPFARELFAQQGNWEDRDRYWPLVVPGPEDDLITVTIRETTPAAMHKALARLAHDFQMLALVAERAAGGSADVELDGPRSRAERFFEGRLGKGEHLHPEVVAGRASASISLPELIELLGGKP